MKKLAFGILCMSAAVLLMSHNSYAVDGSLNITSIRYANYHPIQVAYCTEQSAQGETVYGNCGNKYWVSDASGGLSFAQNIHTSFSGVRFETPSDSNFRLQYNDIISMDFDVYQASANNSLDTTVISVRSITSGFQVIDQQYQQLDNTTGKIKLLIWCSKTEGYSAGAHDIVMVAAKAPVNDLYSWNLGWLRETNAYINPGVVNVFHFQSPSGGGSSFDDTDVLNNIDDVKESIQQQTEQEQQAADNIAGQTPSDISSSGNTENQASTNLIGAFSSFVNALTNIQTGNCNITLAFPAYAGGSQTVNICQNKDKAGNLISVFSSLTLIVFYIPLAIRLLTMIYNEIRSFTNG